MYLILILTFCFVCKNYLSLQFLACAYDRPWWTAFTYPFYHVSIFHLALNAFGFIVYWKFLKQRIGTWPIALILALSTPLAGAVSSYQPTGGASAMVCVLIGIYLGIYPWHAKRFAWVLVFNLIASFFIPVNALIHTVSVFLGFASYRIFKRWIYTLA